MEDHTVEEDQEKAPSKERHIRLEFHEQLSNFMGWVLDLKDISLEDLTTIFSLISDAAFPLANASKEQEAKTQKARGRIRYFVRKHRLPFTPRWPR